MTTRAFVEFQVPDGASADAITQTLVDEFARINAVFSPWLESSELSRINRDAPARAVPVSAEMFALFATAGDYTRLTGGAFDASFAAAGKLYDYRAGIAPGETQLKGALPGVGWRHVKLDVIARSVHYLHADTRVDFGGIAKGHAIDRAVALLRAQGVAHAWVALGGDSFALGERDGRPWQIGIRHPRQAGAAPLMIPARDLAVSTSGDYERFFERDGERVHHILAPNTGKPARGLVSVTILADSSTRADALSTGVFVLGREKGLQLVNRLGDVSAIVIDDSGKVHYSDDLEPATPLPSASPAAAPGLPLPAASAAPSLAAPR
jgi:thiamine biosynthesis lipoprotein